jgi:hypothetical protein
MRISIFLLTLLVVVSTSLHAGTNPLITNLADNTWLKMNPAREPDARNYSGTCWSEYGVWYWGGGHFSYACDDIDFYDMETNTWTRSYTPHCASWSDGYSQGGPTPYGTVWPRHTYQQVAWDPVQKLFFYMGGGRTWTYDPVAKDWDYVAGLDSPNNNFSPTTSSGIQHCHCFYSPDLQKIVAMVHGKPRAIYLWNSSTQNWTKRGQNPPVAVWSEVYSTYISSKKVHFMSLVHDASFYTYNAVTEAWQRVANAPGEITGCKNAAYDSDNDIVLVTKRVGTAKIFYAYHPQTGNWEKINPSGAAPDGGAGGDASTDFTGLWYDKNHKAFFFLNRDDNYYGKTWVYRYKNSGNTISTGSGQGHANTANITIHPNPFHSVTQIAVSGQPSAVSQVKLSIYTISGKLVENLTSNRHSPTIRYHWNPLNQPAGVYLLKFHSGTRQITKRLFLTR